MITPQKKAKLTWNCRRGMLELDLIFGRFLTQQLDHLSDDQVASFELLLNYPDPDLFAWLMGYEEPTDKECADIVAFIQLHDHPE
ncbi:succinate dehydrogenase assembly factor 2 [bacterium]|nr:succinate dehydrogenase assembly factor 2 [bacterium]